MATFPHCDSRIVHSKNQNCRYCNDRPDLQEQRIKDGVNFTGEYEPNKEICPSEKSRKLSTINAWHGNVPMTPEQEAEDERYWDNLYKELKAAAIRYNSGNWCKEHDEPRARAMIEDLQQALHNEPVGARPYSSKKVWEDLLDEVRQLKSDLTGLR